MTNNIAGALRLTVGLTIILLPIWLGYQHRSPLLIPLLGLIYVPFYFLGKMNAWQTIKQPDAARIYAKAFIPVLIVQTKTFESFDAFLAACRELDFDYMHSDIVDVAYGPPPNPNDPDRFWQAGKAGPSITRSDWEAASSRLGVMLPETFFPFYNASNGGKTSFAVTVTAESNASPHHPFPSGPYTRDPFFGELDTWISLATLSDRLDFIDERPEWKILHNNADQLIVIAAAFDQAIVFDYRESLERPSVIAFADLDDPKTGYSYPSVETFISQLRKFGDPQRDEQNEIGDSRISSRTGNPETFWMSRSIHDEVVQKRTPVDPDSITAFNTQWGFELLGLPSAIEALYHVQNGGAVRYRFAPPGSTGPTGYPNTDKTAREWNDVFPGGLLPMEKWVTFDEWRAQHKLANEQPLADLVHKIDITGDKDTKLHLFVIGEHKSAESRSLTLLDMSSDFFNRNQHLSTVEYDPIEGRFNLIFGQVMVDNIYHGFFMQLSALKSELD